MGTKKWKSNDLPGNDSMCDVYLSSKSEIRTATVFKKMCHSIKGLISLKEDYFRGFFWEGEWCKFLQHSSEGKM